MEIATTAYALNDGEKTRLEIFTLDGNSFCFDLMEPNTLLESLRRAMATKETAERQQALLVKRQPKSKGSRVENYDGSIWDV